MAKLSDTKIRASRAREKAYKLFDVDGLFLIVRPDGERWWRQRFWFAGKERMLSLGTYANVSLAEARELGAEVRRLAARGIDPGAQRREKKLAQITACERTFKVVATEWLTRNAAALSWTSAHQERIRRRRETHFDPWIGAKEMSAITEEEIARCLHRIADRGLFDTARRARSEVHQVFRFARQRRIVDRNPVTDLIGPGLLPSPKVKHHPSIKDPAQFGALLRAIDSYPGGVTVQSALKLLALTFVRPGELRFATWNEFDLEGSEWRIPEQRMKMRERHIVPLSMQAVQILRDLERLTGPDGYVFPQSRNPSRPISENTLTVGLRVMGYSQGQMTAHGFRSTASTLLNEQGFNADWIERQLAHGPRDKIRAAYNAAQYLPERRRMMQAWADYLDVLRADQKPAKRAAA